jgi:hypothetical protein
MSRPVRCNFCIHMVENKSTPETKTYECWAEEDEKGFVHKKVVNIFEPIQCEKFERHDTNKGRFR